MKYSKKNIALLAVAVAVASPSYGFSPVAPLAKNSVGVHSNALKRPMPTSLLMQKENEKDESLSKKKNTNPTPIVFSWMKDNVPRSAVVAAAALALTLSMSPMDADAAMSGGRMGGSSFSSRPSMSRSMPSRSYSSGYGGGYYSRGPMISPVPLITPFAPISPFYSPFGYGFGAPGIISFRGPSLFPLLLFGGMALAASNAVRGLANSGPRSTFFEEKEAPSILGSGTSVIKMSVALDVSNRDDHNSILSVLDRLAETSRMDSRMGIQNLSSQVAVELLRRQSSIVSASTEYQHFKNRDQAQRQFNSLSVQERGKFERETLSKFGGVDYNTGSSSRTQSSNGVDGKATMAVVTLVLAIDGDSTKVPKVRSMSDVEEALRKIASDVKVSDCLQGAEILWTPEDRSESLSLRDVLADYPELNTV